MYNLNRQPIHKVKSRIYIAKRTGYIQDEELNQYETFGTPVKYYFNVQTVSSDSDIREFGENANSMKCISIPEKNRYINRFNEFDRVYINTTPEDELYNGDNADYYIYSVRNQNTSILIYIRKIVK